MSDKVVLVFSGQGGNDAIRGLMTEFGDSLTALGLGVVHVTLDPSELQMAVKLVSQGNVAFALTYLGVGQDLLVTTSPDGQKQNIWDAFQIPFLKIHGDIPAYFADRHRDLPSSAVNLYVAEEFMQFRRRWLPNSRTMAAVIPPMALFELDRSAVDLANRRKGKLVFIKNGNSPKELRAAWNDRLSRSIAKLLDELVEEALRIGMQPRKFPIGDFVADHLLARGIDPESAITLVRFFSAQIDDYMRRVKSELIATALLDSPVVVQGGNWGHVDFTGKRAQLVEGKGYDETRQIFTNALGVIDMSPNTQGAPHERIWRAAGCYSVALTNRQAWFENNFASLGEMEFDFDADSIRQTVNRVIANPDRFLDMGVAFGTEFRSVYPKAGFANKIVDFAELALLSYSEAKPSIQPYFVWSRTI